MLGRLGVVQGYFGCVTWRLVPAVGRFLVGTQKLSPKPMRRLAGLQSHQVVSRKISET